MATAANARSDATAGNATTAGSAATTGEAATTANAATTGKAATTANAATTGDATTTGDAATAGSAAGTGSTTAAGNTANIGNTANATANSSDGAAAAADTTVEAELSTAWASVDRLVDGFMRQLPSIILAILVFALFWLAGRTLGSLVRRVASGRLNVNVALVLSRLLQWFLLGLGLLVALAIVAPSVKPSDILSLLGIGSVAIGFAFKDVLQNFLAGMLILIRQPFRVGDEIVFKSFEGVVEDIETRSTRLRTYDGRRVVVPNGEIYTNSVVVNTAYDDRRSEFDVGIGYGDDIDRAIQVILETVHGVPGVRAKPAPDAFAVELAGSSVNLRVRWWTEARWAEVVLVRGRVMAAVREALRQAQIDVPFPTRVVLFHDQTDAHDGDRRRQREGWPAGDDPPAPRNLPAAVEQLSSRAGRAHEAGDASAADARSRAVAQAGR